MQSRKKQKGRKECWRGKCLALVPVIAGYTRSPRETSTNRPTEAFISVDAITRCAEQSGWPTPEAFKCGMLMTIHGVTASEAQAAFADCKRRVQ